MSERLGDLDPQDSSAGEGTSQQVPGPRAGEPSPPQPGASQSVRQEKRPGTQPYGRWSAAGRRNVQHDDARRECFKDVDPGQPDVSRVYRRGGSYRTTQLNVLLNRYVKVRGDLSIAWDDCESPGDDERGLRQSAAVCAENLTEAKKQLESRIPNLPVAASYLALADQALVALYRPTFLRLRIQTVMEQLRKLPETPTAHLAALRVASHAVQEQDLQALAEARAALKDALSQIDSHHQQQLLEDDLQVSRLSRLIGFMACGWLMLMAAVPFVSTVQTSAAGEVVWPVFGLADALGSGWGTSLDLLTGALGLSVVGAVGGMVSGALTVRESRATLLEYRTSMKKLWLRPIFGAVAALTLYLFLSARVINGVEVSSAGIYIVSGFVAGFSERYFLRVIHNQADADTYKPAPAHDLQAAPHLG